MQTKKIHILGEITYPEDLKHYSAAQKNEVKEMEDEFKVECKMDEISKVKWQKKMAERELKPLVPVELDMSLKYNEKFSRFRNYEAHKT